MKYLRGILLAIAAVTFAGASETAGRREQPGQAGDFGAGIIAGSPTGLALKYWFSDTRALDGSLAWKFGDDGRFAMTVDHLWHRELLNTPAIGGRLPFYVGIGLRVLAGEDSEAGIRVPLGVSYLFRDAPFELFAEIAPVVEFAPDFDGEIDGGVGIRYYFIPGF